MKNAFVGRAGYLLKLVGAKVEFLSCKRHGCDEPPGGCKGLFLLDESVVDQNSKGGDVVLKPILCRMSPCGGVQNAFVGRGGTC